LVRELNEGASASSRPSTEAVFIAVFLALTGIAMAIYLVSTRGSANLNPQRHEEFSMTPAAAKGIIDKPSNHTVDETVDRLKGILQSKGVTLFALVDHSGEAEKVGLKMRPAKLLIFGSPKAGTPLMVAAPTLAIDLPLKALVAEDPAGKVSVTYNDPEYLRERHGVPGELIKNLAGAGVVIGKAVE
jgi:uncharacterized protein (DUF302 family)